MGLNKRSSLARLVDTTIFSAGPLQATDVVLALSSNDLVMYTYWRHKKIVWKSITRAAICKLDNYAINKSAYDSVEDNKEICEHAKTQTLSSPTFQPCGKFDGRGGLDLAYSCTWPTPH